MATRIPSRLSRFSLSFAAAAVAIIFTAPGCTRAQLERQSALDPSNQFGGGGEDEEINEDWVNGGGDDDDVTEAPGPELAYVRFAATFDIGPLAQNGSDDDDSATAWNEGAAVSATISVEVGDGAAFAVAHCAETYQLSGVMTFGPVEPSCDDCSGLLELDEQSRALAVAPGDPPLCQAAGRTTEEQELVVALLSQPPDGFGDLLRWGWLAHETHVELDSNLAPTRPWRPEDSEASAGSGFVPVGPLFLPNGEDSFQRSFLFSSELGLPTLEAWLPAGLLITPEEPKSATSAPLDGNYSVQSRWAYQPWAP